jgi:hypothetical protein
MLIKHHFVLTVYSTAEKAKQALASSSAAPELPVQTNGQQFQSAQDAHGNATIGRPIYYQVHINMCKNFSILLAFNLSYTSTVHVLQAFPSTPMQPNQILVHPNTMPVCAPQVFWLADCPDKNLFRLLLNYALSSGSFGAHKFAQMSF